MCLMIYDAFIYLYIGLYLFLVYEVISQQLLFTNQCSMNSSYSNTFCSNCSILFIDNELEFNSKIPVYTRINLCGWRKKRFSFSHREEMIFVSRQNGQRWNFPMLRGWRPTTISWSFKSRLPYLYICQQWKSSI